MPKRKITAIEYEINDPAVEKLLNYNINYLKRKHVERNAKLSDRVYNIVSMAQRMYEQGKREKEHFKRIGLYTLEEAYEMVKKNGIPISFRAFGGRVERKSIPSVKIGRKRFIPALMLEEWINLHKNYYTVREAFEKLKNYEKDLNLRAFIGRVEKGSIPSLKIGTQRWIPKDYLDEYIKVVQNYHTVSSAMKELRKAGIKIRRNAFERRIDRGRIPHVKIGGKRFIPKEVVNKVIQLERERMMRKAMKSNRSTSTKVEIDLSGLTPK